MFGRLLIFGLWLVAASFVGASLTAWHTVALPSDSGRAERLLQENGMKARGAWLLAHYLSAECPCSQAVARHLEERGPLGPGAGKQVGAEQPGRPRVNERVFVIGGERDLAGRKLIAALVQAGFSADAVTPEAAAASFGVEGVPLLKIVAPDGSVRFSGGYREPSAPPGRYLDVAIFKGLVESQSVPRPRVLGCATSRRMKLFLDPLSLKALN